MVPGDRPLYALSRTLIRFLAPELSERQRLGDVCDLAEDFAQARLELREGIDRMLEKQQGTDRLLDDVGEEPGNLPLMEFAPEALWEAR